ncbi:MAG: LUD domain-containing protein [Lachnospiraceae bacterium]|nr:LUD domain-containing protein [Lachnospiraceae bacterium]MCI8994826.1 LUD domain-containing protein [Lachnospiraceae bacterium]
MNREMLKKNFENHGFLTSFFDSKEEAAAYLEGQIQNETVGIGGSMTVKEMGLYELLAGKNQVHWHWIEPGRETLDKAAQATVYLCSANGVAETGELVNIDGNGNRVAMTLFGPRKVYFVVGRNKICPDLASAMERAKQVAAPKNSLRFDSRIPCRASGGEKCFDCSSPERMCRVTVILERACSMIEAEVVFIDEELGY